MRSLIGLGLLILVATALAVPTASGVSGSDTIATFAGTGDDTALGDGGPATAGGVLPGGLAADRQGNVYIGDVVNQRLRKVTAGTITTIAGGGALDPGDGGQATAASLVGPYGVAVDDQGSVYIADQAHQRIRKVSGGVITTVAGNGTPGYSGDGGQATSAQLFNPTGLAVDAQGNLYIADAGNSRVRKVSGGTITTVAGTGAAGYSGDGLQATSAALNDPLGVAVDRAGNLYIADSLNSRIRKVAGGVITTIAGTGKAGYSGDGQGTSTQLNQPVGVAVDRAGNVYVADTNNHRIRKLTGETLSTIAGTGAAVAFASDGAPASSAAIAYPGSLAVDGQGNLYVALFYRVVKIANQVPTATIKAAPASGKAPLSVSFDGSASSDPDGQVASSTWTFGDGTTGTGATTKHTYSKAGTFKATLTVMDDSGATAAATRTIVVTAAASLTATAASVGHASAGKPFSVSFTVKDKKTGKAVKGSVSCTGKLAGKPLSTTHRSTSTSGRATCTWQLPGNAHGKTFAGTIAESYKGATVSRSFSTKVG